MVICNSNWKLSPNLIIFFYFFKQLILFLDLSLIDNMTLILNIKDKIKESNLFGFSFEICSFLYFFIGFLLFIDIVEYFLDVIHTLICSSSYGEENDNGRDMQYQNKTFIEKYLINDFIEILKLWWNSLENNSTVLFVVVHIKDCTSIYREFQLTRSLTP